MRDRDQIENACDKKSEAGDQGRPVRAGNGVGQPAGRNRPEKTGQQGDGKGAGRQRPYPFGDLILVVEIQVGRGLVRGKHFYCGNDDAADDNAGNHSQNGSDFRIHSMMIFAGRRLTATPRVQPVSQAVTTSSLSSTNDTDAAATRNS
ncbi:MAG: hypothetical protein KDC61_11060, partial [Saprospiraceae bacterium]|nr:hypothetical protein [Saprospiraceae bacterium]